MRRLIFPLLAFTSLSAYSADKVSFQIGQGLLSYSSIDSETTVESATSESKLTNMVTDANDMYLAIYYGKYGFYVDPTSEGGSISVSYLPTSDWEFGLTLGINNTKLDEPKAELASTGIELFALKIFPAGKGSLEASLALGMTTGSSSSATTETEFSSTSFGLKADYIHPLFDGVSYVGGISVAQDSGETTETSGGTDVKTENKATALGITLAGLRVDF